MGEFTTLLLNLPNQKVITRRYMCSYYSPMSLFPPYELISLGGIVQDWKKRPVHLIDAIAERLQRQSVLDRIRRLQPGMIVALAGFECFAEDMDEIAAIKHQFPDIPLVLIGHYPTIFPAEVLQHSAVDYVLLGEPDLSFSELYDALAGDGDTEHISGVASRGFDGIRIAGGAKRIASIEELPTPAFDLLPPYAYGEPAMPQPYGMVQTARGCPYSCNYCVRSYGQRMTLKSPEKVIDEIRTLIEKYAIRSLRFIDDTFTINRDRVLEICELITESDFDLQWACLSRTDNLDSQLLARMKRAGCQRIYFGLESGSQRILDLYEKRVNRQEALVALRLCRQHDIETAGFFMMGLPFETEEDFCDTLAFAKQARLSYAAIAPLTLYPGTKLFEAHKHEVDFSLFPYKNAFKDPALQIRACEWEQRFYRKFYLSPTYLMQNARAVLRSPGAMLRLARDAFRGLLFAGAPKPFNNLGTLPAGGGAAGATTTPAAIQ